MTPLLLPPQPFCSGSRAEKSLLDRSDNTLFRHQGPGETQIYRKTEKIYSHSVGRWASVAGGHLRADNSHLAANKHVCPPSPLVPPKRHRGGTSGSGGQAPMGGSHNWDRRVINLNTELSRAHLHRADHQANREGDFGGLKFLQT